jgi:hypothetical protein
MKPLVRNLASLASVCIVTAFFQSAASGQSVWDKLKQQAQGQQQKQQQPAGSKKAGTPQQANTAQDNSAGPVSPPPGTKINGTLLAPYEEGTTFQVSPHGVHAATLSHHGSRPVIIYDGVPGPMFDGFVDLHGGNHPIAFSADGNHFAYCGLMSDHFSVILDGKEVGGGREMSGGQFNCTLFFSPNSRHFFFTNRVGDGGDRQHPPYVRFVIDGKTELKLGIFDDRQMVFSPDGDHFAMVIQDPPGPNLQSIQHLVVDGKIVPIPGGNPQWSADSKHLYTTASLSTPQGDLQELFLDGKPLMRASRITLTVPRVGDMTAALVYVTNNGRPMPLTESWFLVVGGKKIPQSEIIRRGGGSSGAGITKVFISPDGKHYAAICTGQTGRIYVFADGKKGLEYQRLNGMGSDTPELKADNPQQAYDMIAFTTESSKVVYKGFNDPREFLVVGDQEMEALRNTSTVVISPTGDHVVATGMGGPLLDGKLLDITGFPATSTVDRFRFSPDGSHYSFTLQARNGAQIFVDDVPQNGYGWAGGPQGGLWSPDSRHFAYLCRSSNPSADPYESGLCLDGKYIRLGVTSFANLTFSPDGNHVYVTQSMPQGGFRLLVDAHPVLDGFPAGGAGVGMFGKATFQIQPDGTLLLLAQDNTGLKRYSITPSPNTSLATLLGAPLKASNR